LNIRLLCSLGLFSAFLVAVAFLPSSWTELAGVQSPPAQPHRVNLPDPEFQIVAERVKAKDRITAQVVDGALDLLEAAAWFNHLNNAPEYPERGWRKLPGNCDGEKLCRQVILWVKAYLDEKRQSSQAEVLVRELEDELKWHIECNGTVVLPER
jgi:hypothetical protein